MMNRVLRRWSLLVAMTAICALAPLSAQQPVDTDGDGVADAVDCNPADARVAATLTYYFDRDGDMSGNAADPAVLCSASPFPGTTLWHGDPNDADPAKRVTVAPRGGRLLGVDFNETAADGKWRHDYAAELGATATTVHVIWNQIETSPGQFNGPQVAVLDALAAAYAQRGIAVSLTVSPLTQIYLTLPADLAASIQAGTITFQSPAFIERFNALMTFVHGRVSGVQIQSLQIGHEVDRYFTMNPTVAFWSSYLNFFSAARSHARTLWGTQLPVGVTATSTGLITAPVSNLMAVLNSAADHVSVTYLPRNDQFQAPAATLVRADVQRLIAATYPKPLMFQAVGTPSAPLSQSSAAAQAQFYEAFFAVWDEYAALIPFASVTRLFDWSPARAAAAAQAPEMAAAGAIERATAFVQTLGLRDYASGKAKAAYDTLRILALERGFWRPPTVTTRSTFIGFTPAIYDRPTTSISDEVMQNLSRQIGAAGELMLLQFDQGVPWTEALNDTGSGPLPYSANVRETWEKFRAYRPDGARLVVAINPLGTPRTLLAPYWGVGEDFVLNDQFQPVGLGVTRDFHERLLPAEWRNRALDDPAVKTAFTNYAKRAISFFSPDYLVIAIEANLALDAGPAAYQRFVNLQRHVYEALKGDPATADVPVIVSFTAEHFLVDRLGMHYLIDGASDASGLQQRHLQALADSAPYLDIVGLSSYPLKTLYGTSRPAASMFDHLMEAVRTVTTKQVAVTATGYPWKAFTVNNQHFAGSPEKQLQFYQTLFANAEKYHFEFVNSFTAFDMTPYMDLLRAGAAQVPPIVNPQLVEFFKYFEFMGLFELDGASRPAGAWLLDLVSKPLTRIESWVVPLTLSSPNGSVVATVGVTAAGALYYQVDRDGQRIIDDAALGQIVDGVNLGSLATNIEFSPTIEVDETYPTRGVHTTARNHYNGATLTVRRSPAADRVVHIEFRVFDDGVAYRYVVPGQGTRTISGEAGSWTLPAGSRLWHQVNTETYEGDYRGTELGYFNDDIGGPLTAEVPDGGFVVLTEAALRGYSGMTYDADFGSLKLRGEFLDSASWPLQAGRTSPWRVVIATSTLNDLVNSDLVSNLNDAPDTALFPGGAYTGWIKPGRAVWSGWSDPTSGYTFETQRQYVDYAHQLRTEYQLIDAGWESGFPSSGQTASDRLSALSAYSHVQWRDVGLWVWKYWYELADPVARNDFFARVAAAGAVGVKVDNVFGYQSDSFGNVALQEDILRDAAAHRLMINLHGAGKSTGLQRTYPNQLTREGFMGMRTDGLTWEQGIFVEPRHNAALPFVGLVAGPGDYTPVTLDARKIGKTTFAHQLALAGLFTSPLQHWADDPQVLLQQPIAVSLLRTIPVEWEETRVLPPSQIGELALFARKAAGRWYLFAINGDADNARTVPAVALDFLGPGQWEAQLVFDTTATSLAEAHEGGLTSASQLDLSLFAGGGIVAVFSREPEMTRAVGQGFGNIPTAFTADGWQQLYSMVRGHADLIAHSLQEGVPWPEALASSDSSTYSTHLLSGWALLKSASDAVIPTTPRYLMLNPIDTATYSGLAPYHGAQSHMALPAPWNSYAFNHPDVKRAFTNYAIAAIEYFQPKYVAIGIESNILLAKRPDRWLAYKELNQHVYRALKQRYPSLVVFTTVQYEQMLALFDESKTLAALVKNSYPGALELEVKSLLQDSDLFAISTYPFMVENNIKTQRGRLDADYYDRAVALARSAGKRLAFEQSGYISRDLIITSLGVTLPGSEALQQDFVSHLLRLSRVEDVEFIVNFVAQDYGTNYGDWQSALAWAYVGLRRENGTDKPALAIWDAYRHASGQQEPDDPAPQLPTFATLAQAIAAAGPTTMLGPLSLVTMPWPELFVRWQQFASFFPTFDVPPASDPTAPWSLADPFRAAAAATLQRRQLFMPYLQPLFDAYESTGVFALQRLSADEQPPLFLLGDWVLIAPVIEDGATTREVALPAGSSWRDWYTGQLHPGGQTIVIDAPLDRIPLFIRTFAP